ncbi:MAG: GNAT family N-acetyltransferase [Caldilineaceae bacterium]|jgi:GNAT superfamily N-acetyltransferase
MRNQRRAQKAASTGEVQVDSIVVRPLVAADAKLIDAMHQRLSPESVYYRYLQYRKPTATEIATLCHLAPAQGLGFVAITQTEAAIVGLAYYMREAGEKEPTAEPAILVEDHFQGQGIGRRLWQTLQQQAQQDGLRWLRVLSHPQNWRLARLVQGGGLPYSATANGGISEYLVDLNCPAADQANGWWLKIGRLWRTAQPFTLDDLHAWQ